VIGLLFLFILAVYIAAAVFTVKHLQSRAAKYAAIAIYVSIPTWDILPGYIYFRFLCETEGGSRSYKSVKAEGFYSPVGRPFMNSDLFTKHGYKYLESGNAAERYQRETLGLDGKIVSEPISKLASKHAVSRTYLKRKWHIEETRQEIRDMETREVFSTTTGFRYLGGWIHTEPEKLIGMSGGLKGVYCPSRFSDMADDQILHTLKSGK